jgi:hypothetical protein
MSNKPKPKYVGRSYDSEQAEKIRDLAEYAKSYQASAAVRAAARAAAPAAAAASQTAPAVAAAAPAAVGQATAAELADLQQALARAYRQTGQAFKFLIAWELALGQERGGLWQELMLHVAAAWPERQPGQTGPEVGLGEQSAIIVPTGADAPFVPD